MIVDLSFLFDRLVLEDVERAQQRQAAGDHRRELPREDGHVLRLDLREAVEVDLEAAALLLVDFGDRKAADAQSCGGGGLGLALDLAFA